MGRCAGMGAAVVIMNVCEGVSDPSYGWGGSRSSPCGGHFHVARTGDGPRGPRPRPRGVRAVVRRPRSRPSPTASGLLSTLRTPDRGNSDQRPTVPCRPCSRVATTNRHGALSDSVGVCRAGGGGEVCVRRLDGLRVRPGLPVLGQRPATGGEAVTVPLVAAGGDEQVWLGLLGCLAVRTAAEGGVRHAVGDDRRSALPCRFGKRSGIADEESGR